MAGKNDVGSQGLLRQRQELSDAHDPALLETTGGMPRSTTSQLGNLLFVLVSQPYPRKLVSSIQGYRFLGTGGQT